MCRDGSRVLHGVIWSRLASCCTISHFDASTSLPQRSVVHDDDVVIVACCRTPLTRAKRGGLKDTPADDLVAAVLKETIARTGVEPAEVGDVVMGSVLGPSSQRANECRMAMFYAGFPESVPVRARMDPDAAAGALNCF